MQSKQLLGQVVSLELRRFASPGAYLALDSTDQSDEAEVILLPRSEVPEDAKLGAFIDVFVYLDSEDRPVATVRAPKVELGQVAFLKVMDLSKFGAFVDWGLLKDLLVPYAEQTVPVKIGQIHPVGLYVDKSGRLAGTMRVSEMLRDRGEFKVGEWVEGEAWRYDPRIGVFVILEKRFVGLLRASEPHNLERGQAARFRVSKILPDGKVEVSLRGEAHEELQNDGQKILELLYKPDAPKLGDHSNPELVRDCLGLTKKAFKRAVGRLLKEQKIVINAENYIEIKS
jgi:hypothetical protein